jgi:hypothetical protein
MANTFVNAGDTNISTTGDVIYTCGSGKQCLIHSLYLSNVDGVSAVDATVDLRCHCKDSAYSSGFNTNSGQAFKPRGW